MCRVKSLHGNIHGDEQIRMIRAMGAPRHLVKPLTSGVDLTFKPNTPFHKLGGPNNKSALDNRDFVTKKLRTWLDAGFLTVIKRSKAKIISGISVDKKFDHQKKEWKTRLCFDGHSLKQDSSISPAIWMLEIAWASWTWRITTFITPCPGARAPTCVSSGTLMVTAR